MPPSKFTIRVYGIYINENNQLLLSDEFIQGKYFTKFPGGGLEFGEGIFDCLKREWMEEVGIDIEIKEHFYTNDFFIASVFNPDAQVISIYYIVEPLDKNIITTSKKFDFLSENKNSDQSLRFQNLEEIDLDDITLLTDRTVVELLKKNISFKNLLKN